VEDTAGSAVDETGGDGEGLAGFLDVQGDAQGGGGTGSVAGGTGALGAGDHGEEGGFDFISHYWSDQLGCFRGGDVVGRGREADGLTGSGGTCFLFVFDLPGGRGGELHGHGPVEDPGDGVIDAARDGGGGDGSGEDEDARALGEGEAEADGLHEEEDGKGPGDEGIVPAVFLEDVDEDLPLSFVDILPHLRGEGGGEAVLFQHFL